MSRIYDTIIVSMIQYNLKPVEVRATRPGEPSGNKIFASNKTIKNKFRQRNEIKYSLVEKQILLVN